MEYSDNEILFTELSVGWSLQANVTYFLWTSNPVHDLSLEDKK